VDGTIITKQSSIPTFHRIIGRIIFINDNNINTPFSCYDNIESIGIYTIKIISTTTQLSLSYMMHHHHSLSMMERVLLLALVPASVLGQDTVRMWFCWWRPPYKFLLVLTTDVTLFIFQLVSISMSAISDPASGRPGINPPAINVWGSAVVFRYQIECLRQRHWLSSGDILLQLRWML